MLGIGGKFAGAKGMVAVPDLSNKTPDEALTVLQDAGLRRSGLGSSGTSNSGLNNKVFQQSISAGTLVDYETEISYDYYYYVAPAAPEPYLCGDWYRATQREGFDCTGGEGHKDYIIYENRKNYCLNGSPTGNYIVDPNSIEKKYEQLDPQYVSGRCGCCTPAACQEVWTPVGGTAWCGSCIGGEKIYAYREQSSCTGDTRVVSTKVPCCSFIGCGSTYQVSTGTWTYDIMQQCYSDDGSCDANGGGCSTTTRKVGSGCIPHCDIWRDVTSCVSNRCSPSSKQQSQKCQASDCSYYYNYRTVLCPC